MKTTRTLKHAALATTAALTGASAIALVASTTSAPPADNPESKIQNPKSLNVLLIALEDMPRHGLGTYGGVPRTPHLDAFARTAVLFNRAYCQSPVCNPSRTAMATGIRPDKTGVWGNTDQLKKNLPPQYLTMPEYFKAQGFYTVTFGKFFHHNYHADKQARAWMQLENSPTPAGYDGLTMGKQALYKEPPGLPPNPKYNYKSDPDPAVEKDIEKAYQQWMDARAKYPENSSEYHAARKPFQIAQMYRTGDSMLLPERDGEHIKMQMAATRLRQFAADGTRFFMSIQTQTSHAPFRAPKKYLDMYPLETVKTTEHGKDKDVGFTSITRRNDRPDLGPKQFTGSGTDRHALQAFYACCSFVDDQIKIILDALDETGLAGNTIVIVWSDHGFQTGQHDLWCKNVLFEESSGVPLMIRVPGSPKNGTRRDELVELIDIFPTLIDLLNLPPLPRKIDGESLVPLLKPDRGARLKQSAYTATGAGTLKAYGVRHHKYSYGEYIREGKLVESTLFDLEKDPHEHINLVNKSAQAGIVKMMIAEMNKAFPNRYTDKSTVAEEETPAGEKPAPNSPASAKAKGRNAEKRKAKTK